MDENKKANSAVQLMYKSDTDTQWHTVGDIRDFPLLTIGGNNDGGAALKEIANRTPKLCAAEDRWEFHLTWAQWYGLYKYTYNNWRKMHGKTKRTKHWRRVHRERWCKEHGIEW